MRPLRRAAGDMLPRRPAIPARARCLRCYRSRFRDRAAWRGRRGRAMSVEQSSTSRFPIRPPHTEAEIRAGTIGPIEPLTAPIELAEPDATWPELYAREERRLRAALGDRVLRIEHTGSTSVPGLAAKPIVDITMIVPSVADEAAWIPDLEAAGYVVRI